MGSTKEKRYIVTPWNWWENHDKTKNNKADCLFYGIYSISLYASPFNGATGFDLTARILSLTWLLIPFSS